VANGLEVRLLGPPQVFYCGQTVKFAARKALALFAYLAVETPTHPRERLQAIFWPESETRQAQFALRTTLARIKEALRSIDEPLRMEGDRIGFNNSLASTLDLNLITQATMHTQPRQMAPATIALLQSAVDALRGPFMDGFSLPDAPAFDEWLTVQRAHWGQRVNLIHDRLSSRQLETYLIQPAIETVTRWLVLDHLNETAYQRLMRLHFLNGDRSAALQTYESYRNVLNQELGIKPSTETEDMLAFIRSSQTPALVTDSGIEARKPLRIPFVGRSTEYQGLVHCFRSIKKGKPQVVVLSGESGIGKTRLSDEFLKWAGTEGADILRGRAFETSGQLLPYQPIIDALRERLERENAPEDLLDDVWLAELTRILPELRERYPDLPATLSDDSTARARLFEAIARLTEALSARHPLVWLMDDLQWADAETLDLLHYLSRNWRKGDTPILLLILMRNETLGYGSALRDWLSGLIRDIPLTRFNLSAMNAEDMGQLISSLAGENAPGSSELSAWFIAETSGQPFFLAETLTALNEYRALIWHGEPSARKLDPLATLANLKTMGPQSLAPAIRDVVLSRLEWLSQSASTMLSAAAVIGRNCSFDLLSQVSGTDEQDSLNALDELLSARMIVEIRNEGRPYTVSHDRIREVVYTQLSTARQQIFHRRTLTALTDQNVSPAELAHHALSAKEWQFAFQHSVSAGDEAMRLFAVAGAAQHYENARALLNEDKADVDHAACQHLYMRLGKSYELEYQYRKALEIYEELQALASARENQEMELAALVARCLLLPLPRETQDIEKATVLAEEALLLAQELADLGAQAQIEYSLGRTHKFGDEQIEPAIIHFKSSAELARRVGLREQLALVTLDLGISFSLLGRLEPARLALLEAVEIFRELGHHPNLLTSLQSLAIIHMAVGEFDIALTYLEEAHQSNKLTDVPGTTFALATTRNVIHIIQGEYDRVMDVLRPALEMDETQIIAWLQAIIRLQFVWCYYDLGAYEEGLLQCRRAISNYGHINPLGHSPAFTFLALLQIRREELTEAEEAVMKGWENLDLQSNTFLDWWEAPFVLSAEAELALAQGDLTRATRSIDQLLAKYNELNLRHFKPGILYFQARVELAAGHKEEAYRMLSNALALSDEMGARREVWEMCAALSNLEAERGDESAAVQFKQRACHEAMFIAEHAGTPELRQTFLSRADVQLVVGA
jgi:DNA-binding SARP family transcriptional activator